jgi:hypothetical protein
MNDQDDFGFYDPDYVPEVTPIEIDWFQLEADIKRAFQKTEKRSDHEDHEVITNSANGKNFLVCRQCKVEVE